MKVIYVFVAIAAISLGMRAREQTHRHYDTDDEDVLRQFVPNHHPAPYAVTRSLDYSTDGKHALRFEVRHNDVAVDLKGKTSFRSELFDYFPAPFKKISRYSFELLIPQDFPIENKRLVVGQWWCRPDKGEGRRSPALAQRFINGTFSLTMRHHDEKIMTGNYGHKKILYENKNFPLGLWNHFVYDIHWSYKNDGMVKVWLNGNLIVHYVGPVGYNDDLGPYLKIGIYRANSEKTYVVYFKNIYVFSPLYLEGV